MSGSAIEAATGKVPVKRTATTGDHGEDAQGVIEFALIVTALLLVFLGTVDFSRFLYYTTAISNAARTGAEAASNHCFTRSNCATSSTPASADFVMWSVYCEARPLSNFKPSYGVYGSSSVSLGPDGTGVAATAGQYRLLQERRPSRGLLHSVRSARVLAKSTDTPTPTWVGASSGSSTAPCTVPPGQTLTVNGTAQSGDWCTSGCKTGNVGDNCDYDMCVQWFKSDGTADSAPTSGDFVYVYTGYNFQAISFVISAFFPTKQCWQAAGSYNGDSGSHTICGVAVGKVS